MRRLTILAVFICLAGCATRQAGSTPVVIPAQQPATISVVYRLTAARLDLQAIEGYPQEVLEIDSSNSPYDVTLQVHPDPQRAQGVYWNEYEYPPEVEPYRHSSPQVETSPAVCDWADQFYVFEGDIVSYGAEVLEWMSENLKFDSQREETVNTGAAQPAGSGQTLQMAGASSAELAHLFIAAMRCKTVPARFILGYIDGSGYRSWAEVYLYGIGWTPVDAAAPTFSIPPTQIRLFAGMDFAHIGIIPADIDVQLTRLDQ